jgi:hypothetical protein
MRFVRGIGVALALAGVVTGARAADTASDEARGKAWWAHVQVLADDSRRTGCSRRG